MAEHGSSAADLGALLEDAASADVALVVGGSELPAHSLILAARSPVFAAMLRNDMQEARNRRIQIADMQEAVLRQMLCFMYTDLAPELESMSEQLLAAADKYDLPLLKESCAQYMARSVTVENAAASAVLALLHRCTELRDTAVRFIASHPEVMATEGWALVQRGNAEAALEICKLLAGEKTDPSPLGIWRSRILTEQQKQVLTKRLLSAASDGRTSEVWALLRLGAPVDAADGAGDTALLRAIIKATEDTVKCLIDAGADVNIKNSKGVTPLHCASCRDSQQNIIWMLVRASACVDVQEIEGQTPLHWAAKYGKFYAAKALLLAGASMDLKDNSGKTPADVATSSTKELFNTS